MKTFIENGQKSILQSTQSIFIRKADVFFFSLAEQQNSVSHLCGS